MLLIYNVINHLKILKFLKNFPLEPNFFVFAFQNHPFMAFLVSKTYIYICIYLYM